ncbi:ABC transporter permease [Mycolicibacterium palauense]|uniref:ABC transporter permease n=1 Tax=Mycolicibacterium palauense TaxID=2034511 RepID=UPI001FEBE36C|nr:ABC transporter permease [Mycolicibacterium palauense]
MTATYSAPSAPSAPSSSPAPARGRRWPVVLRENLAVMPLVAVVAIAVAGPFLVPFDPEAVVGPPTRPPDGTYWFGTDSVGLDVFSRTIAAAHLDLAIAAAVMVLSTTIGIVVGLLIGMNEADTRLVGGGARGAARFMDLLQALPAVVIGLVVVSLFGAGITTIVVALTVVLLPTQVRLVRTEVLRVRSEAYLDAARMAGLSERRLTIRHVLPNSSWPALENASVLFGIAITLTATLGFLGVGIPQPTPEWGSMIARGASDASVGRWWPALFPALALVFTVASVAVAMRSVLHRRRR